MKLIWKKMVLSILLFCFIIIILPDNSVFATAKEVKTYVDVAGHKYEKALLYVIENGLMSNNGSKIFPDSKLTKGAACLSLNNLLGATAMYDKMNEVGNLKKGDRYYTTISIGLNCGYLRQKENGDVDSPLGYTTYGYLADLFSSILGMDMKETIIGSNHATDVLTRAEYAVVLQKLAPNIITENKKNKVIHGDTYIKSPNVTLSDMTVDGNLIITEAVGNQEVTLINVIVLGKIIVRGGDPTVTILGESKIDMIMVYQLNNNLKIKVEGDSVVESIYIHNKCSSRFNSFGSLERAKITVQGNIKVLTDASKYTNVYLENSVIESVFVTGEYAKITVDVYSFVNNVVIEELATNAWLYILGDVNSCLVEAKNVMCLVYSGGYLDEIKGTKVATGLNIESWGRIYTVISYADQTLVFGDGTVKKAEIYGEDSEVITNNTIIIDEIKN